MLVGGAGTGAGTATGLLARLREAEVTVEDGAVFRTGAELARGGGRVAGASRDQTRPLVAPEEDDDLSEGDAEDRPPCPVAPPQGVLPKPVRTEGAAPRRVAVALVDKALLVADAGTEVGRIEPEPAEAVAAAVPEEDATELAPAEEVAEVVCVLLVGAAVVEGAAAARRAAPSERDLVDIIRFL